jgi:hypothetical protein
MKTALNKPEGQGRGVPKDKLKLLALFAVAGAPLFLAMYMYFGQVMMPTGTTNNGQLILPPLNAAELVDVDESLDTPGPWTLLTFGEGPCETTCEETLYKIQQVNVALGRDANRVRHMLVAVEQGAFDAQGMIDEAALGHAYPNLQIRRATPAQKAVMFEAKPDVLQAPYDIYVVDPLGNLMMQYSAQQPARGLLDDMKKLLRVSKIG